MLTEEERARRRAELEKQQARAQKIVVRVQARIERKVADEAMSELPAAEPVPVIERKPDNGRL